MERTIKGFSLLYGFCSLLSLFFFINQTISQPDHMQTFCNHLSDNFTQTSSYRTNRETLLSTLLDRSSLGSYSNATTGLSPNTVYGMFLCRGDITRTSCTNCVQSATLEIAKNCTYQKEAVIFYKECMVRYSDFSFFTLVEDRPYIIIYSLASAPNSNRFPQTLLDKMNELIIKASSSSSTSSTPYFVADHERVTQLEGSYNLDSMAQCSPDLDTRNCTVCLRLAAQEILNCCSRSPLAHIFTTKCLLKYEASALPQNVPSFSGSNSINIIKGNGKNGRFFIAVMTAYVLSLLGVGI